ncbi:MAG: TonB-dependent receptor [Ferruginibacter sp.]|nr:TonB-dependent receptor [Bacteroidota bacterium]MBX2919083.1 TonB-dependent receptor [Ferruginibacter sp.]MCB0710250.1 TonB-dependent receptor [Chitinophagaceae bacterium]MCC7377986.1 TonB-dependent receptor [Chitinophagaceae bacterium]
MTKIKHCLLLVLFYVAILPSAFSQEVKPPAPKINPDTTITETLGENQDDNIPTISLDESQEQDVSTQNISSQLGAGRDPFLNAASFKFGAVRFRIRGYDANEFNTYINGAPMENLDNGFTPFGQWGGLNDVLRNRESTLGLKSSTFAYGDLGGLTNIDTRASHQRKQTSINYAASNRNYSNRIMLTHSTGLNMKGWAFSFSASRRWATEGYTDGTYYDGWSFFAAVDKRFNDRHLLSFAAFATPTENGRQGASVKEMTDIAGDVYYNPNWGYQNGKKRNASIAKSFQPIGILTHDWKITDKTSLLSSASVTFGNRSVTGLDWYNAADPRPDYYRYLPSYQKDPALAEQVREELLNNINKRQINWDALYQTNYGSYDVIHNANGIAGNDVAGLRSHYVVEERIINTTKYNFNSTLNSTITENIIFTAGLTYQSQKNHYYKKLDDLLGGDFYVDINQFGERDFPTNPDAGQNDLNNPNRIVKVGDKLGYNYNLSISKGSVWMQGVFKFRKVDVFVATEHSYTSFFRYGNVRSGLFPNDSYGKSATYNFYNSSIKGGVTYKINGRNYVFANGSYGSRAPYFENAFIAPRTRDFVQDNLKSEEVLSTEVGYVMNAPKLKIRLNGYYTQFKNQLDVLSFYNDEYQNFVNYAISNIGKIHTGIEFGAEAKIYKGLSLTAAAAIGQYTYNTRQSATVTADNSAAILDKDVTVYAKDFYVPTPQQAYTIGFDYRSPKFWFINVNFNYFDKMYLNYNPIRRTASAVNGIEQGSDKWHQIIDQTKLEDQYTLDAFAGYSWMMNRKFTQLKKRTYLVFNVGVNNILNNKNIVSGGYEQLRFDFAEKNADKFPAKRFYAYGINFFASVGIRF